MEKVGHTCTLLLSPRFEMRQAVLLSSALLGGQGRREQQLPAHLNTATCLLNSIDKTKQDMTHASLLTTKRQAEENKTKHEKDKHMRTSFFYLLALCPSSLRLCL